MATDPRQPTRSTFAFNGPAASQSRPSSNGASRGAQVVGGATQSEVVTSGQQTDAGPVAGQLGQFFEGLMKPYVERKQKEQFFKGFAEAAHGTAVEELTSSGSPITKIFGPTGFEQGAQFFTAQTALDQFSTDIITDIGEIRKLPPAEAAKLLSSKSDAMMTGDNGTNMLIQAGLMERMGPVMNTVAKARMEWQQTTAKDAYTTFRDTAGRSYQATMVAQAALTAPTDADRTAVTAATEGYLGGAVKPEGMTDDTYGAALAASARSDIIAGNFYAVGAMKRAGGWKFMDEETQNKLDILYTTQSAKALSKAAVSVVPDLIKLHTAIKIENVPGGAMGAAAELARINGVVRGMVGTDEDLFDYKDFDSTAGSVVDVLVASQRRLEARQETLTDMQTRRGWDVADRASAAAEKAASEAKETGQTTALWGLGDITGALAVKPGLSKDFNALALAEIRSGNFGGVIRAWKTSKWVSPAAATQLQTATTASIGNEYNADVGTSHKQWQSLYKESPSVAAAYYGDMHAPMLRFDTLLRTNAPQNAFAKAFGNPTIYHPAAIPQSRKTEAAELIPAAIASTEAGWYSFGGRSNMNASGLRTATTLLTNRVATLAAGDQSLSTQAIVNQALAAAQADGSMERYGAFVWGNRPGTPSLSSLVGLQGKEMDEAFTSVVDYRLKKSGYKEGAAGSDYTITRMRLPNGHPAVHIEAVLEDGSGSKQAIISVADFQAYSQHKRDRKFLQAQVGPSAKLRPGYAATRARYDAYNAAYPALPGWGQ